MAPRRVAIGSVVSGKYRLIERLGGGGMGEVYRAEHQLAGRIVALKLLRADFAEDEELTRRFFQEAQAVNRIRHPNIVDVLDAGFSDEGPYVAMECLEGTSLSGALVRVERLDLATALSVILPMLDALDAAHRHGIVHRDLKPENVFLARNTDGASTGGPRRGQDSNEVRVKLVDFGIAKVTGMSAGPSPRTHTGVIFGTPDYLSPEQASGEGLIDGRSDIFAVGIVLFELLTGRRPFESKSAVATAYRIVHEPAPSLASMGVKADLLLQTALDIALSKHVADRFATAVSFADMLAPLVPDGATRREKLRALLEAAAGPHPAPPAPAPQLVADTEAPPPPTGQTAESSQPRSPLMHPQIPSPPPSPNVAIVAQATPPPPAPHHAARESPGRIPAGPTLQSQDFARSAAPFPRRSESMHDGGAAARDEASARVATAPAWPKERPPEKVAERPASAPKIPVHPPSAPRMPIAPPSTGSGDAASSSNARHHPTSTGSALSRGSPRGGLPAAPLRQPSGAYTPSSMKSAPITGTGMLDSSDYRSSGRTPGPRGRGGWSPRPLPSHVRGKCHTRGTLPRAVCKWVERTFGAAARAEVLDIIPTEYADTFRSDGYNALVWYDLEATDMFVEASTAMLMGGDVAQWRELARDNFDQDLAPILRPARLSDPVQLIKRSPAGWARVYDFGTVKVAEPHGTRIIVRVDGFDATSLALRYVTLGSIEGMIRSAGAPEVAARILLGEASFARDFEYEIAWQKW